LSKEAGSSKLKTVLAAWGLVSIILIVFLLATQAKGISTLFSVVGLIKSQSLTSIKTGDMLTGAAAGIVDALKDPYSQYLDVENREKLNERMSGEFGGIGVYILQDENGRLRLIAPIEGTPAYKIGVKHNDIILQVDGESVINMNPDDVSVKLRGEPGTQVSLNVFRESSSQEYDFKINREIISVPSVMAQLVNGNNNMGYVRLSIFQSHSKNEMQEKIDKLLQENNIAGLILDIRDNGGGDFDAATSIASLFLNEEDIVVSVADAKGDKIVHKSNAGRYKIPLVVLVNGNSASASEILAGALQDNNRAELVGETTYGKGLVQTVYVLPDGGALKLTTAKYYTPNGNDIHEIGIVPDEQVAQPPDSDRDLQLDKAVELLKAKIN
jgi:carboxyl-terminal processing protease